MSVVVANPPHRRQPAVLAAAATVIQVNRSVCTVLVPVFGLVLLVLALKKGSNTKQHTPSSYAFVASLAVLFSLAGSLGSHAHAEAIIKALLSFFLGIPVLHLTSVSNLNSHSRSRRQVTIRTTFNSLLLISISSATLVALLQPFLTSKSSAAIYLSLPTGLFFAYTFLALLHLIFLFSFEGQLKPKPASASRRSIAIDIHVATQGTSTPIPIKLSRPCFSDSYKKYRNAQQPDGNFIELLGHRHQKRTSVDSGISIVSVFKRTDFAVAPQIYSPGLTEEKSSTLESPTPPRSCTRNILPFFFLVFAQLSILAAYSCTLAILNIPNPITLLGIFQTWSTAIGVMATMTTYFLQAYNAHLASWTPTFPKSLSFSRRSGTTHNVVSGAMDQTDKPLSVGVVTPPMAHKSLTPSTPTLPCPILTRSSSIFRSTSRGVFLPSKISDRDHDPSMLEMTDGDKNEREMNSLSVGSLNSAYGGTGSDESDQTRFESIAKPNTRSECATKKQQAPVSPPETLPRRFFGSVRRSGSATQNGNRRREGKTFVGMGEEGRCGTMLKIPSSSPVSLLPTATPLTPTASTRRRESRKLKRNTAPASSVPLLASSPSHPPSSLTHSYWNSDSTLCRTTSRGDMDIDMDMNMGNMTPVTPVRTASRKLVKKRSAGSFSSRFEAKEGYVKTDKWEESEGIEPRGHVGVADPSDHRDEEISSRGGLTLKRSFKLGDGKTLSPSLTLSAATGTEPYGPRATRIVGLPFSEAGPLSKTHDVERAIGDPKNNSLVAQLEGGSRTKIGRRVAITEKTESEGIDPMTRITHMLSPPIRLTEKVALGKLSESKQLHLQKWSKIQTTTPTPTPEKSRAGTLVRIRDSKTVAQPPHEDSLLHVFIPSSSGIYSVPSPSTTTPTSTKTTSTPSKSVSWSSSPSVTTSSSLPDQPAMIFRSWSDSRHDQRFEKLPGLARISSVPSPTKQTFLHDRNAQTPITPRGPSTISSSSSSSSPRLSAITTIGSMKNAFAGVWNGKGIAKTAMPPSPVPSTVTVGTTNSKSFETSAFGGVTITEYDSDGDFMDLRDPFASPAVRRPPSGACVAMMNVDSSEDGHGGSCEDVFSGAGGCARRMNEWGRLQMPLRGSSYAAPLPGVDYLPAASSSTGSEARTYVMVARTAKPKKHRKEGRTKKATVGSIKDSGTRNSGTDFDIEEALLTQKLLKRLDDEMHGSKGYGDSDLF